MKNAEKTTDPRHEQASDAIIGHAFRRSLLTLAILLILALALIALRYWPAQEGAGPDVPVAPPRVDAPPPSVPPSVRFTDVTAAAGIAFTHTNGAYGAKLLPETMGSGAAFFDYDNDDDPDLLLINSTNWPERRVAGSSPPTMHLYRNDGHGRFENVTSAVGLAIDLYGMGVAIGDYDGDGWRDIYVTALGGNRLLRNRQGRFEDATATAGVAGGDNAWSTSAAFVDVDNDADLDLFVANYVHWSPVIDREVDFRLTGIGRAYGPPTAYQGTYSTLYRNNGDGTFTDVSAASGIHVDNPATGQPMGKALAVVPVDLNRDGAIDLLVANDTVQNFLFTNQGQGRFVESGTLLGVAFDRNGSATGAMGVDVADFRDDSNLGIAVGNFANEMTSLYVTQGAQPPLADEAIVEGIGPASRLALTFGLFFFDYDLDGRLDLLQANGHLENEINRVQPSQHFAQPPQLFWNCGTRCRTTYLPVELDSAGDFGEALVGRGATYADVDGDGDLDVLITQNGAAPRLLRNDQGLGHHWLRVRLVGTAVNRDAIGSWVELRAAGRVQRRQVMPTRSYLSQVELPVTFGLGPQAEVEELRVHWADGSMQTLSEVPIDTTVVIEQQAAAPSR